MYQNNEIWHENYKDERELEKAKAITSDCAKVTLYVYGGTMPKGIESDSNRVIESYIEFAKIYCTDRKTRYVPCDNIDDFHTYNLYFLNFDYLDIFNIFFVNRDGQPVQIDRLLRNNDKRFKKHFSFPHNISKMARAGYFDTLEPPEPEEELPPDYLAYCDPITGVVTRNPKFEKQEGTESASSEKITPNPKFVGQSWDDFKEKMDQRYGGSGVIEVGP